MKIPHTVEIVSIIFNVGKMKVSECDRMMNEETTTDALKWVETLIKYYKAKHDPETALHWILQEVQTCLMIAGIPDNDGTRFREATEQLNQLSVQKARDEA